MISDHLIGVLHGEWGLVLGIGFLLLITWYRQIPIHHRISSLIAFFYIHSLFNPVIYPLVVLALIVYLVAYNN